MKLPAIQWPPPTPLGQLQWNRYRLKAWYPIGARVELKRWWWVDFPRGIHYSDCIRGTITGYWKSDMNNGIDVMCDDGKQYNTLAEDTRIKVVEDDAQPMESNGREISVHGAREPIQTEFFGAVP